MGVVREGLRNALLVAAPGPFIGGTITIVALVLRHDIDGVAQAVAFGFWLLAVVLPVMTLLLLAPAADETPERLTRGTAAAAGAAVSAMTGAGFAVLLFIAMSSILAPVIRRFDAITYSRVLRAEIGWGQTGLVLGVTAATALVVAVVLARRAPPAAS